MDYIFTSVKISLFDLHIAVQPLLIEKSKAVKPDFLFLVEPDSYQNQYLNRSKKESNSFLINSLSKKTLKKNYFWNKYKEIWSFPDGSPDFWRLQMPWRLTPKEDVFKILHNKAELQTYKGIKITIEPDIFLSTIGWSTNISINLEGRITPSDLVNLVHIFRNSDIQSFLVNFQGNQTSGKTLSKLYESLGNMLRSEVFNPEENSPADNRPIARYQVISIKKYEGTPLLYKKFPHDKDTTNRMKVADQLLMHSILYGRTVDREERSKQIKNREVLFTQFDDANFALTEFGHGTLHFMQELGRKPKLSEVTVDCMGNNICISLRMIFLLYHFYKAAKDPQLTGIKDDIRHNIRELYQKYRNKLCRNFYENHGGNQGLKKLIEDLIPNK